ncbi:MAG: c-type cytochrome biogenesis protein CcsB [bacterium]|nr:c-type cytochrome biogenesis protein CcsB [bacterium]
MKKSFAIFLLLCGILAFDTQVSKAEVNIDEARLIPVLHGGRVKPLDAYAREMIYSISEKGSINGVEPLKLFFIWMNNPEAAQKAEVILIDYLPLREKIGLDMQKRRTSYESLANNSKFHSFIEEIRQLPDAEQKKIHKEGGALFHRAMLLQDIFRGEIPLVPSADPSQPWASPIHIHGQSNEQVEYIAHTWIDLVKSYQEGNQSKFDNAARELTHSIKNLAGTQMVSHTHLKVEAWYHKVHPARWAWIFYLISFLLFLAVAIIGKPQYRPIAVVVWMIGFVSHLGALLLRAYISGRAPWSNMYESMQMMAFGIVFFALMFEIFGKVRYFLPASAVLGMIALIINDSSPFDPFISPLVPVLKSYWLTYHVMIMMLGYSACALAMGIGHFVLGYEIFGSKNSQILHQLDRALYRVIQLAMLFLIAGIILGAMWANESWGRYWGWDPKETWSLITWFYYLALAHGRFSNWWKRTGTAVLSIVGFPVVLMTYYGVNYFLVGLHSYAGGGKPEMMPPLVWFYLIFEVVFLVGYWVLRKRQLALSTSVAK